MAEAKKEKVVKEKENAVKEKQEDKKEKVVKEKEKVVKEKENVVVFRKEDESNAAEETKKLERVAPQWIVYNKVCEFLDDPEVTIERPVKVEGLKDTYKVVVSSDNYHKIQALAKAFKAEIDNVQFEFVYEGEDNEYVQTLADAFEGNKHFDNIRVAVEAMSGIPVVITTFKDETIQYKADNRFVPGGYSTTLQEKLVKEFFRDEYRRSVYVTKEKGHELFTLGRAIGCDPYTITWTGDTIATTGYVDTVLDSKEDK